ncbi:hypothetical protein HanPSC8_Chr02g0071981 [Helianthus annuus]|nr:hypothetical protein HanIR_Chr02g0087091 [Helianthus annuus]KAJ0952419.1 hypothetical protein HanPSC8_Chr02g0071981 [Helianthus annuus]
MVLKKPWATGCLCSLLHPHHHSSAKTLIPHQTPPFHPTSAKTLIPTLPPHRSLIYDTKHQRRRERTVFEEIECE